MAKSSVPRGKLVRKFGENIFGNEKISKILERKNYPPGQHGQSRRRRPSNYAMQLREKQKMKYAYGLLERQFRNFFEKAEKMQGETGVNLLQLLERRLDNVVYRLGFSTTRSAARQLVNHRHLTVNGKIVNIPSYILKIGDVVQIREKSRKMSVIHDSVKRIRGDLDIPWLKLDKGSLSGSFEQIPEREHLDSMFNVQLVVELYSK